MSDAGVDDAQGARVIPDVCGRPLDLVYAAMKFADPEESLEESLDPQGSDSDEDWPAGTDFPTKAERRAKTNDFWVRNASVNEDGCPQFAQVTEEELDELTDLRDPFDSDSNSMDGAVQWLSPLPMVPGDIVTLVWDGTNEDDLTEWSALVGFSPVMCLAQAFAEFMHAGSYAEWHPSILCFLLASP